MNKEELIEALSKSGGYKQSRSNEHKEHKKDPSAPGQGTPAPKGANPDQYKNITGNQS